MDTTLTSGNLKSILKLLDEKGADFVRTTEVIASGMLADLFDKQANLKNRDAVRAALGLTPLVSSDKPKPEPTIVELGEYVVNYGETIAEKLAAITDAKCIGWYNRDWATDEKFPDARTGKKKYKASAVHFGWTMAQDAIERWCRDNKKILARPKDGIDLASISPRPKLDNVMPLALAGQFFGGADGGRGALDFRRDGGRRGLHSVWLDPRGPWSGRWWFLVLEELPSGA